jgi:hypothetical protein
VVAHGRSPGDDAKDLLEQSLAKYRSEQTMPARVILHKTSSFSPAELEGFQAAADDERIDQLELTWVPRSDPFRLFRQGEHLPLRGTMVSISEESAPALHARERPAPKDLRRNVRAIRSAVPDCPGGIERNRDRDGTPDAHQDKLERDPARRSSPHHTPNGRLDWSHPQAPPPL